MTGVWKSDGAGRNPSPVTVPSPPRMARCEFAPRISIHMRIDRAFCIDIDLPMGGEGKRNPNNRSERRTALVKRAIMDIFMGEIEAHLPDGYYVHITGTSGHHGAPGYREFVDAFMLRIDLPKTTESEELAILWVLRGDASFDRIEWW